MDKKYEDMTYEELAALSQNGDEEATEFLIREFRGDIRTLSHRYYIAGADSDDVMQEAMIGLVKAIGTYDPSREASFRTYAGVCMSRQILTAARTASRKKNSPLNSSVSLNRPKDDEIDLEEIIAAKGDNDPEMVIIAKEIEALILNYIGNVLSDLEREVLVEYMKGMSCGEIAEATGRDAKTVYNAIGRAKKKIAEVLEDQ
jgi:RNA polymerase sporulation-specific sigma factor